MAFSNRETSGFITVSTRATKSQHIEESTSPYLLLERNLEIGEWYQTKELLIK